MRMLQIFLRLTFLFTCLVATSYAAIPVEKSLSPMLKRVLPSIVNIRAQIKVTDFAALREIQKQRGALPDDDQLPDTFTSVASGVIVDGKNGYVLTNAHVVADAKTVTVTLNDGHHYTAKIIGVDKPSDVAVLQIKGKNLTAIHFGDSRTINVGDFVAAIGNPFGLSQTVTSGIVSALGRTTLGIENYENFIQTDAPINPGNSGGALINLEGDLVGINTAILAPERGSVGIGFAIPVDMAKVVMDQLLKFGNVKRGLLGITAQNITPELAQAFNFSSTKGAAVTYVLPSSPAQLAGVQIGDIIVGVNDREVKTASDVINTIGFLRVNSAAKVTISRHNQIKHLMVTLSDPAVRKTKIEGQDPYLYGVTMKNFSVNSALHGNVNGIFVLNVEPDSSAWRSDLHPGDIITSANQMPVHSVDELLKAVSKTNAESGLLLNVMRGAGAIYIVVAKETDPTD